MIIIIIIINDLIIINPINFVKFLFDTVIVELLFSKYMEKPYRY
ncbi:MAG: hypothetical protein PWQ70_2296 [Clostridiales bacterium]|jgi:hypothetical protein|nr:hypothetical protein [Clostridiales bacterium]